MLISKMQQNFTCKTKLVDKICCFKILFFDKVLGENLQKNAREWDEFLYSST